MTKYIDAEKLIAEIESISLIPQTSADYNDGRDDMKMMVLDIIDSLQQEQSEVDLEKEIQDHIKECLDVKFPTTDTELIKKDVAYTARKFYELGLNAKKEK